MLASIFFGVVLFAPAAPVPKELKSSQLLDFEKLVALYEVMPPETAAKRIEELCDQGLMRSGLRILEKMKPTKVAKLLEELPNPLAAQHFAKLFGLTSYPTPLLLTASTVDDLSCLANCVYAHSGFPAQLVDQGV